MVVSFFLGFGFAHLVVPSHKTDSVVHHGQEGVHARSLVDETFEHILIALCKLFFFLSLHCQLEKNELSFEFFDLHALVQLEGSINPAQTSVQKLVEVNPTVVTSDAHL